MRKQKSFSLPSPFSLQFRSFSSIGNGGKISLFESFFLFFFFSANWYTSSAFQIPATKKKKWISKRIKSFIPMFGMSISFRDSIFMQEKFFRCLLRNMNCLDWWNKTIAVIKRSKARVLGDEVSSFALNGWSYLSSKVTLQSCSFTF